MPIQAPQKKTIDELIAEAHRMLGLLGLDLDKDLLEAEQWEQTWPTTACGFGGVAGQAFTQATTTVVTSEEVESVVVFHNDILAYLLEQPSDQFNSDFKDKELVGKTCVLHAEYEDTE